MKVTCWQAAALALESSISYQRPFYDVQLDAIFTHENGKTLTIPAFWDGGNLFILRFALPLIGEWNYKTVCSDPDNSSLLKEGTITVLEYTGDLDIYKHGFIKTIPGQRYFMYNDGTPFFYIGDTHWNMAYEEFDSAGDHAGDLKTDSHFKYIVDARVEQGFTVYQSEPISAKYDLHEGFTEEAIEGFRDFDRRFAYIAEKGLVHTNAQLFFARELATYYKNYDDKYLELLSRYWVARYSAYPVMWTMAQEVDCDFYYIRGDQRQWDAKANPWKKVAVYIYKHDPYKHPLTAHQMYSTVDGDKGVCCSTSSFRNIEGHTWYGIQWGPALSNKPDFRLTRDFWYNGQGKVTVNYEGRYDHLWTKHLGARVQGWTAYLNGMFGHGYGAIDIWLYKSKYDIDRTSNDGVDEITPADKQLKWSDSVHFESAYQMGYMRSFFEKIEWHKLVPRFDDAAWCGIMSAFYSLATIDNDVYVAYFYNRTQDTGVLRGLDGRYSMRWYNPRHNAYTTPTIFTCEGEFKIGNKPDNNDWMLLIERI